jgi:chromosome segregation ATPase
MVTPRFKTTLATVEMVDSTVSDQDQLAAMTASASSQEEKDLFKLKSAIIQIKGDIVRKVGDLKAEANWVEKVKVIITGIREKVTNVRAAVERKKVDLKNLLTKKRQLENLLLQLKLKAKLSEAKRDLGSLTSALSSVAEKKATFATTENEVKANVASIVNQLKILNGGVLPNGVSEPAAPAAAPAAR